jgi:hypothetical protein
MPQEKALSFIKTYLIAKISQKCQKFIMKNNSCPPGMARNPVIAAEVGHRRRKPAALPTNSG